MESVQVTARLTLRQFTQEDADNLLALDGDPRVMRFLDPTTKSRAQIRAQVLPRFLAYDRRYGGFGFWAAHARGDGGFIGWFGLRPVTPTAAAMVDWPDAPPGDIAVASLGYRLRVSAWGRGYATEGAQALIQRAFSELGVSQVVATTMAVNSASRRVLEKAGLRYVRTVHLDWPDPLPGNEHGDVETGWTATTGQRSEMSGTLTFREATAVRLTDR
ncbi:MAG TPA: GNAT family N-acetyltransferase [Streptosporangiaceae bacterium]|nr:GNAT family N-acetyltransferase [Streptosporangiaceae bacterium]